MASTKTRSWIIAILALLVLLGLAFGTYLYFQGREYRYRFSEQFIQEKLAERLPMTKTYLAIFQVTLDQARVFLKEGEDRIHAGVDITLNLRINNASQPLGGSVDLSGGINYVAEEGSFFLIDPVIERLAVQGLPEKYLPQIQAVLTKALTEFYAGRPLYTLNMEDKKQWAARLVLKQVIVEDRELVVTLGI